MTTQTIAAPARSFGTAVLDVLLTISHRSDLARRSEEAKRLYALSDAELADIGLTRDRVLHRAFGPYLML